MTPANPEPVANKKATRKTPAQEGAMLDTREASAYLKVSPHHLRSLIVEGILPATRISARPNSRYRIDPSDLQAFLLSRRTA